MSKGLGSRLNDPTGLSSTKSPFFPNKRQQQSMLMYNELFIAPKQKDLEKLKKSEDTTIGKSE